MLQMQGRQILRNEAYIEVRRNDEGCSITQQMDFLRSRQIKLIGKEKLCRRLLMKEPSVSSVPGGKPVKKSILFPLRVERNARIIPGI